MWPISNLLRIALGLRASLPRPVAVSKSGPAWGPLTPAGFWAMHGGDLFYCILGLLVWKFAWPGDSEAAEWPTSAAAFHTDFGGAVTAWASSWVGRVVFRNLIINITIYELWHQVLFGVLTTDGIQSRRYNKADPYAGGGRAKLAKERAMTFCGFLWSTAYECFVVQKWASGEIAPCPPDDEGLAAVGLSGCRLNDVSIDDIANRPLTLAVFVMMFPLMTQMRGVHFFVCHRIMHPWYNRKYGLLDGDVGAFLYRHVHSLHHASFNPGPWSSLSMHPVEHLLYFSAYLVALVLPVHPLHLLLCKYHTDISALAGHDGHADPGAADVGHYLHHAHFECNYGFSFPNYLDKFFGTYENGSRWAALDSPPSADVTDGVARCIRASEPTCDPLQDDAGNGGGVGSDPTSPIQNVVSAQLADQGDDEDGTEPQTSILESGTDRKRSRKSKKGRGRSKSKSPARVRRKASAKDGIPAVPEFQHPAPADGNTNFTCDLCKTSFLHRGHLNRHFETKICRENHSRQALGIANGTATPVRSSGGNGIAISTSDKHSCDVCDQSFLHEGHLNRHKLTLICREKHRLAGLAPQKVTIAPRTPRSSTKTTSSQAKLRKTSPARAPPGI